MEIIFILNATKRACYFCILAACSLPLAKFKALNLLDFWSDSEMKKNIPQKQWNWAMFAGLGWTNEIVTSVLL